MIGLQIALSVISAMLSVTALAKLLDSPGMRDTSYTPNVVRVCTWFLSTAAVATIHFSLYNGYLDILPILPISSVYLILSIALLLVGDLSTEDILAGEKERTRNRIKWMPVYVVSVAFLASMLIPVLRTPTIIIIGICMFGPEIKSAWKSPGTSPWASHMLWFLAFTLVTLGVYDRDLSRWYEYVYPASFALLSLTAWLVAKVEIGPRIYRGLKSRRSSVQIGIRRTRRRMEDAENLQCEPELMARSILLRRLLRRRTLIFLLMLQARRSGLS